MKIIILLLVLLVPFKTVAFEKADCSLKCKGRFYSQKGLKILQDILRDKKKLSEKDVAAIINEGDADKSLTMGCLTACNAKDIRDTLCFVLSQESDESFVKKLSDILRPSKKASDFSADHEKACKKIFPKKTENISTNYTAIRKNLGPKSG